MCTYIVLSIISYSFCTYVAKYTSVITCVFYHLSFIIYYNRLDLTDVFNRAYTYLNCNDDNTVVLAVTNAIPDDSNISDAKITSQESSNVEAPYAVSDVAADFVTGSNIEALSDVADTKDFITQPYPKMNTLQCSTSTKPPDMPAPAPHTLPRVPSKGLVSQPFGVHPYAIVNLEKVRNLASSNYNFVC